MRALCTFLALLLTSCGAQAGAPAASAGRPPLPARPSRHASSAFWRTWGDGKAELSGYDATVPRYHALHDAELVLIYVTEPLDRETLIKDDEAPRARQLPVLKLNASLKFQTGVYPYSILTSIFSPVDGYLHERFAPVKLTMTAQEWCGHVYEGVWPGPTALTREGLSYFADEGEVRESVRTPEGTLYEDALLIQLRELDGAFLGGARTWHGDVVPSLWRARRTHQRIRPLPATLSRAAGTPESDGTAVDRFTLHYEGGFERTFDVEQGGARRVVGWQTTDGEVVRIRRTSRLAYWQLHDPGDESHREELGESGAALAQPPPPAGNAEIGF